jgi:hypothetical protein
MFRHVLTAFALAAALASAVVLAATPQMPSTAARKHAEAASGGPIKLFAGREAGPNESYLFCVIDVDGRLRRCPDR